MRRRHYPEEYIDEWEENVEELDNGCWAWHGKRHQGYSVIGRYRMHVMSLELKLGRPIALGMMSCHTCDNSWCTNPEHLYEGTNQTNGRDARLRKRHEANHCRGDDHWTRKFPERLLGERNPNYRHGRNARRN